MTGPAGFLVCELLRADMPAPATIKNVRRLLSCEASFHSGRLDLDSTCNHTLDTHRAKLPLSARESEVPVRFCTLSIFFGYEGVFAKMLT